MKARQKTISNFKELFESFRWIVDHLSEKDVGQRRQHTPSLDFLQLKLVSLKLGLQFPSLVWPNLFAQRLALCDDYPQGNWSEDTL